MTSITMSLILTRSDFSFLNIRRSMRPSFFYCVMRELCYIIFNKVISVVANAVFSVDDGAVLEIGCSGFVCKYYAFCVFNFI